MASDSGRNPAIGEDRGSVTKKICVHQTHTPQVYLVK